MVKLKIVSDGGPKNTKVIDAETGECLVGVTAIEWEISYGNLAVATVTIEQMEVDLTGRAIIPGVWHKTIGDRPRGSFEKLLVYTTDKGIFEASFHNGTFFTNLGSDFHPDLWMIIPTPPTYK